MGYTKQDLESIQSAIAKGELEVQYADRRVKYRSIAELREARTEIVRDLNGASGRSSIFRLRHAGKGVR
ncbi:phage head-tail joining protein [Burkholderia sp. 22PA0099]|uniref:phage head-tail joining protein n=1 Tax=Burkholderia sp. 22PA0099 TaxID=3237372 RepID=UPI0039C130D2